MILLDFDDLDDYAGFDEYEDAAGFW